MFFHCSLHSQSLIAQIQILANSESAKKKYTEERKMGFFWFLSVFLLAVITQSLNMYLNGPRAQISAHSLQLV